MDVFRREGIKACVDHYAQPQIPCLLENGEDAWLIHIEILIIRVQFDAL